MLGLFFLVLVIGTGIYLQLTLRKKKPVDLPINDAIASVLESKVTYYQNLSTEDKVRFCDDVATLLQRVKINGVGTEVTDEDRILVGASGTIPIFAFSGWKYPNLGEVLLYPDTFSAEYDFKEKNVDRNIMGMVGNGPMNRVMILSKPALHEGFNNKTDKNNTGIHEFVHLLDKVDGDVDGVPSQLLGRGYVQPWLQLIHEEIKNIQLSKSDINPYGTTNEAEFFAVASEYFFERPVLFQEKHPELFELMEKVFKQDLENGKLTVEKD